MKYTALDADSLGFKTKVVLDATRAVNVNLDDGDKAIADLPRLETSGEVPAGELTALVGI